MAKKINKIRRVYLPIKEQNPEVPVSMRNIKILSEAGKIWVQPQGYGEKNARDGFGYPVSLEIWEGKLRLIIFDNINSEEPQIIDLENARESNRVEE